MIETEALQQQSAEYANSLIKQYGPTREVKTPAGDLIMLLPTCTTPMAHLLRENWERTIQMGNVRSVLSVDRLNNGQDPALVIKSPERVFTTSLGRLSKNEVWWGGPRSGEGRVRLEGNPIVELQSTWEAIYLLELQSKGIPSELPQALIQDIDGRSRLVVGKIEEGRRTPSLLNREGVVSLIRERTSLVPVDSSGFNNIVDPQGNERVIDVNRWLWPPHSDDYRAALGNVVQKAITIKN